MADKHLVISTNIGKARKNLLAKLRDYLLKSNRKKKKLNGKAEDLEKNIKRISEKLNQDRK